MPNPVTATHDPADGDVLRPPAHVADHTDETRFARLFTRAVRLAITTVEDELGRPLVGVFVPDRWLL